MHTLFSPSSVSHHSTSPAVKHNSIPYTPYNILFAIYAPQPFSRRAVRPVIAQSSHTVPVDWPTRSFPLTFRASIRPLL